MIFINIVYNNHNNKIFIKTQIIFINNKIKNKYSHSINKQIFNNQIKIK
jgi:hypothetical protein